MALGTFIIIGLVVGGVLLSRKAKAKKKKVYDFPAAFPDEWDGRTVELVPDRRYRLPGDLAAEAGYTLMTIEEFEMTDEGIRVPTGDVLEFEADAMPHLTVGDTDDSAYICYLGEPGWLACVEVVARQRDDDKALPPGELPEIEIAADCSEWDVPEEWIVSVARPRFEEAVDEAFASVAEGEPVLIDPVAVTHYLLEGELGECPEPQTRFTDVSPDLPADDPNYYPHDVIIGLYGHIYEAVDYTLNIIGQTGDPSAATIFEIIED